MAAYPETALDDDPALATATWEDIARSIGIGQLAYEASQGIRAVGKLCLSKAIRICIRSKNHAGPWP